MRAGIETIADAKSRLAGEFDYVPRDPLVKGALLDGNRLVGGGSDDKLVTSPSQLPSVKAGGDHQTFAVLSQRFLDWQTKGKIWDAQTVAQARKSYALFQEINGDMAITAYSRSHAQRLKEVLQELPWDYGKAACFRGKSILDMVAIDAMREGRTERLSTRTVKRHFAALSGMWRWAVTERIAAENPFVGFNFPSLLRANDQRDMWTAEELAALFATPVWTGSITAGRRSTPGHIVVRDEKYWLPLIAIFSGLRQEEAAQLHLEDIRRVEGHWVFDINARPPRMLKNRNAVRKVPVHTALVRLGLLDYVAECRNAGATLLFPNLKPGGADGRLGHSFSKWFTRYRKDVGLYRAGLDFHSFRHSATTFMQRAGVPIAAIDELTGHATLGETARYSHGLTMEQLVDAIERIVIILPFDRPQ